MSPFTTGFNPFINPTPQQFYLPPHVKSPTFASGFSKSQEFLEQINIMNANNASAFNNSKSGIQNVPPSSFDSIPSTFTSMKTVSLYNADPNFKVRNRSIYLAFNSCINRVTWDTSGSYLLGPEDKNSLSLVMFCPPDLSSSSLS